MRMSKRIAVILMIIWIVIAMTVSTYLSVVNYYEYDKRAVFFVNDITDGIVNLTDYKDIYNFIDVLKYRDYSVKVYDYNFGNSISVNTSLLDIVRYESKHSKKIIFTFLTHGVFDNTSGKYNLAFDDVYSSYDIRKSISKLSNVMIYCIACESGYFFYDMKIPKNWIYISSSNVSYTSGFIYICPNFRWVMIVPVGDFIAQCNSSDSSIEYIYKEHIFWLSKRTAGTFGYNYTQENAPVLIDGNDKSDWLL